MKLAAFDIPDDPQQLAEWLEHHLVSLDLGTLVAELSAVHPEATGGVSTLRDLFGPQRLQAVLDQGLTVLQPAELRRLLTRPKLLLELQDLVLFAGGSHWQALSDADARLTPSVLRGEKRLQRFLRSWRPEAGIQPARLGVPWYRQPLFVASATAAAVLLGVLLWQHLVPFGPGGAPRTSVATAAWGWSAPDALPQDLNAPAYLNRLADGANEWFAQRPESAVALADRLSAFRRGCTQLQLAENRPLGDSQRKWLLEKCRLWAAKLDKHLADVEAGRPPLDVRAEADETISRLVAALREEAAKS